MHKIERAIETGTSFMTHFMTHQKGLALLKALIVGALACSPPAMAQAPASPARLGMEWLDYGNGCHVLAEAKSHEPIINPFGKDSYAVGAWDSCPPTTPSGAKLTTFEAAAVHNGGVRLYAPWGRIYVFPFYPQIEKWGYDQKFRFEWIPPEKF